MKKLLLIIVSLTTSFLVYANDGDYAVSKISPVLLKNAYAIKRADETILEVSSLNKVKLHEKFAVTVLNENGDPYAILYKQYDKLHSIESIEGTLYDANGKKLKTLKKSEVLDRSAISGISLY